MVAKTTNTVKAIDPQQIGKTVHDQLSILGRILAAYELQIEKTSSGVLIIVIDGSQELFVPLEQATKIHTSDFLEQEWLKDSTLFVLDTIKNSEIVKQLQDKYADILLCLTFPNLVLSLGDRPVVRLAVSFSLVRPTETNITYLCLKCYCPVLEWAIYGMADFDSVHKYTPTADILIDANVSPKHTIVDYVLCTNCGLEITLEAYCDDYTINRFEDLVRCALRPKLENQKLKTQKSF